MSDSTNASGKGWEAGIGAAIGAIVGESGLFGGGAGGKGAQPAVTPDQLQATLMRDGLSAQIAALGATVVSGNQQTAMALCGLGNTVVAEGAATRSRIDQLEIGGLRDKLAERDLRIAEIQNASHHAATQNIIVNAQANANAGGGCNTQLLQALQVAAALRANQCPSTSGN